MPTDSASVTYGDGYDKCGSRIHYLLSSSGEKLYPDSVSAFSSTFQPTSTYQFLEFLYFPDGDPRSLDITPIYQINIKTENEDHYGLHQFQLYFEFADYPDSTANLASQSLDI